MSLKKCLSAFLSLLTLFALLPFRTAAAAETSDAPVRVAYFTFSGYHEIDSEGRRSGYGYDFLQMLASHTDWTYEYRGYDWSYAEALDKLRQGEVDIVTSVSKTPEREKEFLFSDLSIGTNSTMLTVRAGDERYSAGDYTGYDGMRIAMLVGNSKSDTFDAFAKEKGFGYEPVLYDTEAELAAALQNGEVDGAVSGSLRALQGEWVLESFAASDFYIVTRLDRPDLMAEINAALEQMSLHDPDWRTMLHEKYYATDSGGQVLLDADERDYLAALRESGEPLTVLANPDRMPYSYWSEGEPSGVIPELFSRLAEQLGLSYTVLPADSREAYYELRESGAADIVLDYSDDYYLAEHEGYKLTSPYLNISFARLSRRDFSGLAKVVATISPSDMLGDYVAQRYPDREIVYYDTADKCVDAVLDGKADGAVLYSYTAERIVQQDRKNRLSFTLLGDADAAYAIGVRADLGHLLLSALDKAAAGINYVALSDIIVLETNMDQEEKVNLIDFLYANPGYMLLIAVFLMIFLLTFLLLMQRTRNQKKLKKRVDEVSERYEQQQKSLAEALAMADQANRAKTTFLNNMSHDIRTPMNAITGYTALALTHLDNREQAHDYLTKIAQSSSHLLSLINDVLDMSRIEAGHFHVETRPENLADILHALRNIVQADIHAKRLELYIDTIDIANENIRCDKLRVSQILLNLLSNAIKFTEPGGTISLRVAQKPGSRPGQGLYEFRVKDTGIGMSEEFAAHIFEPFTRERTSTVSGIQGTGLGMAITKNIVDMMNGTIRVQSKQGEGTEFTVELEFAFGEQKEEPGPIVELKGLRALVADDDLVSCQSVSKMLRQIGMRAEWTCYGKEAVVRAGEAHDMQDPFAVYIIDWSMPDQNGIETVRCIRRVVGNDAPIILFSAYDWTDIEQEAREAGATDFISKPLFASDLHRVLEHALGHPAEEEPVPELTHDEFVGRRLLLVEDNELNREIATELLTEEGFLVESAENGKIAVDMVASSAPGYYELVLMDVQMPVMNGYEATEQIRKLPDPLLSSIPVIAMTANAFEEDKQRAAQAGMDGYIAKPIDIEKMFELLRKTLNRKP